MTHQFSLFGFQRPVNKVPISAQQIREAKALFENGDYKLSAEKLRGIREKLEDHCNRIKV